MTENIFDIQTISTKRTGKQAGCILLLGQLKEEKANPSNFLKFLLPTEQKAHLVLPNTQTKPSQNPKSRFLAHAPKNIGLNRKLTLKVKVK